MRVFVTGGTGYLGSTLLRLGSGRPWVLGASYWSQPPAVPGVAWVRLDVRDAAAVEQALKEFRPEVVIHTAYSKVSPAALEAITVQGTVHVARACRALGARLIHLSTDQLFDGENPPYAESAAPNPLTEYGQAKLRAEHWVQAILPTAAIVRTSLIWGLNPLDVTSQMVLELADGKREGGLFRKKRGCGGAIIPRFSNRGYMDSPTCSEGAHSIVGGGCAIICTCQKSALHAIHITI